MKKFLPAIIVILCLSLITSCKKSDDKLILGTWEAKSSLEKTFNDGVSTGEVPYTFDLNELTIEFKSDNTYTAYENGSFSENGDYSIAGDQLTIDFETGSFTISKTNLDFYTTWEETVNGHLIRYDNEMHLQKK